MSPRCLHSRVSSLVTSFSLAVAVLSDGVDVSLSSPSEVVLFKK